FGNDNTHRKTSRTRDRIKDEVKIKDEVRKLLPVSSTSATVESAAVDEQRNQNLDHGALVTRSLKPSQPRSEKSRAITHILNAPRASENHRRRDSTTVVHDTNQEIASKPGDEHFYRASVGVSGNVVQGFLNNAVYHQLFGFRQRDMFLFDIAG